MLQKLVLMGGVGGGSEKTPKPQCSSASTDACRGGI